MAGDFDPFSPEVLKCPFPHYSALRERCPVAHVDRHKEPFWVVTRYDDVKKVSSDYKNWTKRYGALIRTTEQDIAMSQDPPAFASYRQVYADYLTAGNVEKRWSARMASMTNEFIERLLPLGRGDLHDLFAMPLPMRVMSMILGIPDDDDSLRRYKVWSDFFIASTMNEPDPEEGRRAIEQLYCFFEEHIESRRRKLSAAGLEEAGPEHLGSVLTDDLISHLLLSRYEGRRLTPDELNRTIRGFFIGGNETTTSLLLNILHRLFEKPERWERYKAEPSPQLTECIIEESLRLDPPTFGMFRVSTCPVQMHGVTVPPGERILYAIPGANRDPDIFTKPDEFDMDRSPKELARHVAFGYGPHKCPGAPVSRLEVRIALPLLAKRLPKLRLTGAGERITPFSFWGFKHLPAAWD